MTEKRDWVIEFYVTESGTSPVGNFLKGLDDKTQARFIWSIEQLRLQNVRAGEPLVKHIDGKLWELRRASDGNIYRLIFLFRRTQDCLCSWISEKDSEDTSSGNRNSTGTNK